MTDEEKTIETSEDSKDEESSGPSRKIWAIAIIVLAVVAGGYFISDKDRLESLKAMISGQSGVAAVVNGEKIMLSQVEKRYERVSPPPVEGVELSEEDQAAALEVKKQILDGLVGETLILQKAAEENISVSSEELDTFYNSTIERVGGQEALEKELIASKITAEELREDIRRQLLAQKYLDKLTEGNAFNATDEEINAFYEELKEQGGELPPLEGIRDQIESEIKQQKFNQLLVSTVDKLKGEARIEVLLE